MRNKNHVSAMIGILLMIPYTSLAKEMMEYEPIGLTKSGDRVVRLQYTAKKAQQLYDSLQVDVEGGARRSEKKLRHCCFRIFKNFWPKNGFRRYRTVVGKKITYRGNNAQHVQRIYRLSKTIPGDWNGHCGHYRRQTK